MTSGITKSWLRPNLCPLACVVLEGKIKVLNVRRIEVFVERFDARPVLCYEVEPMAGRIALSLLLAVTIVLAPVGLSARPCVVINTPSEKACAPACCANKTCCETSHQRTGSPVQPLAKSASDQQNVVVLSSQSALALLSPVAIASSFFSFEDSAAHSPPRLALTCIRLI